MRISLVTLAVVLLAIAPGSEAPGAMLAPGDPFPAWSLRDQSGEKVSSSDLAGRTYLLWYYPAAMTPGCTAEGKALRDAHPRFEEKGVEILGVSFDEPAKNAEFAELHDFPYRLLSDDGSLASKVGAGTSPKDGYTRRISYLVGADGKVVRAYENVVPAEHAGQVLSDLPK